MSFKEKVFKIVKGIKPGKFLTYKEVAKKAGNKKPVISFIAGKNIPGGKRFGHAGAIIQGNSGTAKGKIEKLKACGVHIADIPWLIGDILTKLDIPKKIYE